MREKRRIIVGVTGASGVIMAYHLVKALKAHPDVESHLIITETARLTWGLEADKPLEALLRQADVLHDEGNLAASIASGSFYTEGMIIIPCSMKTLAGIVSGYSENLLLRAADVCLKENRKLILVPRESPLGKVHLRNLSQAADLGCVIAPPMLTFYGAAQTIDDQIQHLTGKILMQFKLPHAPFQEWKGVSLNSKRAD